MSDEAEHALRHAVRIPVVLRYAAEVGLVLGAASFVPALCAAVFDELDIALAHASIGALLLGLGILARRLPTPRELQPNEALVVGVTAFALAPLLLCVPFAGPQTPWIDAFFEAVSGVTTTGLSTLASVEARPKSFLLARAWLQWIGGMGIVVLFVALTLESGLATRRLGAPSLAPADVVQSVRAHARRVFLVYVSLTVLAIAALLSLGASPHDALLHALAGISTGGFAPRDDSLARLAEPLRFGVIGVCLAGAISLTLYADLRRGRWRRLRDDAEVRALFVAIPLVATGLWTVTRLTAPTGVVPHADLALLAVSSQTTAGFSTLPVAELPAAAKEILILSMLTGGSLGSTAGGVKLLRVLVVVRLVQWLIVRTRLPAHAVSSPTLGGERLDESELLRATAVIALFVAVVAASWLPFLACGYDPLDALFEVASATGTVGLSVGIARPALEPALKGVLCADMLFGRLEIFAILAALSPRTWIGRRTS